MCCTLLRRAQSATSSPLPSVEAAALPSVTQQSILATSTLATRAMSAGVASTLTPEISSGMSSESASWIAEMIRASAAPVSARDEARKVPARQKKGGGQADHEDAEHKTHRIRTNLQSVPLSRSGPLNQTMSESDRITVTFAASIDAIPATSGDTPRISPSASDRESCGNSHIC